MIILPDRNIPRARLLMPIPRHQWDQPSARPFHNAVRNQTRFKLVVRAHDGPIRWVGWFDDRDDADAFMFAMVSGSLRFERDLWRMPTPAWHPDIGEGLIYLFVVTFLTATGAGTYNRPADFNDANNSFEGIGGGGTGGSTGGSTNSCGGGGGGEYRAIANFTLGASAPYVIGAADADTTFNTSSLIAKKGVAGTAGAPGAGGAGGSGGTGTTARSGGAGGTPTGAGSTGAGGGGGGAGGSTAAGTAGAANSGATGGTGGAGGTVNGGAGGTCPGNSPSNAGGTGTLWDASHGAGGGGGGSCSAGLGNSGTGGAGGLYGGGGGGGGNFDDCGGGVTAPAGAGKQGILVVTYLVIGNSFPYQPNYQRGPIQAQ